MGVCFKLFIKSISKKEKKYIPTHTIQFWERQKKKLKKNKKRHPTVRYELTK